MTLGQANVISKFILDESTFDVLELGFRHGVSTCYIAAALETVGKGHITTVDREIARTHSPQIEELLARAGLSHRCTVHYEPTSYTWTLMRYIQDNTDPIFDLAYIDGAHSWFVDGFAFFLVDRLLRDGGWIIFDDMNWSFAKSKSLQNSRLLETMPDDERTTPQVRLIFDLLVKRHPGYGNFREHGSWGFAQKMSAT